MSQQAKKSSGQSASKVAGSTASKAAKNTLEAVESSRDSAENVVRISSSAVKDLLSNGASEAQKVQEKAFEMGRESAQQISKSADAINKSLSEMMTISRDNVEAAIECGNLTASLAKDVSGEIVEYASKSFSENVELSKDIFACRTINDMVDLQTRVIKNSFDSLLNQSGRISNMFFEFSSEALEPINERMSQASEQLSKTFSEVA
ncbi:MAG: phasin family protein [Rickettsiales bacterium]